MRNRAVKSELKTATRRVHARPWPPATAPRRTPRAWPLAACMDKAASKGVIHKNQAANRKCGVMALVEHRGDRRRRAPPT